MKRTAFKVKNTIIQDNTATRTSFGNVKFQLVGRVYRYRARHAAVIRIKREQQLQTVITVIYITVMIVDGSVRSDYFRYTQQRDTMVYSNSSINSSI